MEADKIRRAAEMYAEGKPSAIFYTLGITEHTCGTENVQNMANLAMLCGQIGKPSSGVNPLRGQNNVQGGCDMGAIHSVLPGYQKVADPVVREKFAKVWKVEIPTHAGGRVTDFIERAHAGVVKGFYVFGEDPVASEPNQDKVIASLKRLEFLVVQEIFMSETAKLADVILPADMFCREGRHVQQQRASRAAGPQSRGPARRSPARLADHLRCVDRHGIYDGVQRSSRDFCRDGFVDAKLCRNLLPPHREDRTPVALPDKRSHGNHFPARRADSLAATG